MHMTERLTAQSVNPAGAQSGDQALMRWVEGPMANICSII